MRRRRYNLGLTGAGERNFSIIIVAYARGGAADRGEYRQAAGGDAADGPRQTFTLSSFLKDENSVSE